MGKQPPWNSVPQSLRGCWGAAYLHVAISFFLNLQFIDFLELHPQFTAMLGFIFQVWKRVCGEFILGVWPLKCYLLLSCCLTAPNMMCSLYKGFQKRYWPVAILLSFFRNPENVDSSRGFSISKYDCFPYFWITTFLYLRLFSLYLQCTSYHQPCWNPV